MRRLSLMMIVGLLMAASAQAQGTQIPAPTGPVVFCGIQRAPVSPAPTYQLVFDGGTAEAITLTPAATPSPGTTFCQANAPGFTHSFTIAANRFTLRETPYSVTITATNAGGSTTGNVWSVQILMAPGLFEITGAGLVGGAGVAARPSTAKPAKPLKENDEAMVDVDRFVVDGHPVEGLAPGIFYVQGGAIYAYRNGVLTRVR